MTKELIKIDTTLFTGNSFTFDYREFQKSDTGTFGLDKCDELMPFIEVPEVIRDRLVLFPISNTVTNPTFAVYTDDGLAWNKIQFPAGFIGGPVCWGDGRYVSIGYNSRHVLTSTNGIDWVMTSNALPAARWWTALVYGDGLYVATPMGGGYLAYSSDGVVWTEKLVDQYFSAGYYGLAFGNGRFVWLDTSGGEFYWGTAADIKTLTGAGWDARHIVAGTIPMAARQGLFFAMGKFFAFPYGGTQGYTSVDGVTWVASFTMPSATQWLGCFYANGLMVVVDDAGTNKVASSSDGVHFTGSSLSMATTWQNAGYINGRYLVCGWDITNSNYSLNGNSWANGTVLPAAYDWWNFALGKVSV